MIKSLVLVFIFLISGCTVTNNRGYYFSDEKYLSNFDVYNFTKQDLLDNIGYPSIELDKNVWLYYSYTTKNYIFLKPKIKNESILLVYFDNKDNIKNFSFVKKENTKNLKNIKDISVKDKIDFSKIFEGVTFTPINE